MSYGSSRSLNMTDLTFTTDMPAFSGFIRRSLSEGGAKLRSAKHKKRELKKPVDKR